MAVSFDFLLWAFVNFCLKYDSCFFSLIDFNRLSKSSVIFLVGMSLPALIISVILSLTSLDLVSITTALCLSSLTEIIVSLWGGLVLITKEMKRCLIISSFFSISFSNFSILILLFP